jgi:hypothetical protein
LQETAKIRKWLETHDVLCDDYLVGRDATFDAVLQRLISRPFDIIHYAGHVVFDDQKEEYALRLNGGQLMPSSVISNLLRGDPLVFLNSCWSAKAASISNPVNRIDRLADAFIRAGARLFVGSVFATPDLGAGAFAENFYDSVLSGRTAGEAMRLARKSMLDRPEFAATWASFVLYGDPSLRIEIGELPFALEEIGLSKERFDKTSYVLLERSISMAGRTRFVTTLHLLAALITDETTSLGNALARQNLSVSDLREKLCNIFERRAQNSSFGLLRERARFSNGARDVLWETVTRSAWEGRVTATNADLTKALLVINGSAREMLRKLGANLSIVLTPPSA